MNYDIFNGDADGICALLQLRLAEPREATLITGVKRDISLVKQVDAQPGDQITVLDIAMEKNLEATQAALDAGATVMYVDHHFPGDIPQHSGLSAHINEAADTCTSVIVNGLLKSQQIAWAITGAYGDNLYKTAQALAANAGLSEDDSNALCDLGTYINYNGYGSDLNDLHFKPAELYQTLYESGSPFEFIINNPDFLKLRGGYNDDMAAAAALEPIRADDICAIYSLPDAAWARRISGVFGNDLARQYPDRAHAVLTEKANGNYLVSVRAPLSNKQGAVDICRQFPTGGGRAAAAGINDLPADQLVLFMETLRAYYAA